VEGFEKLNKIGPCISVYGSARAKPGSRYYLFAEELGSRLVQDGFGVITGGGPGIMEAANKGAMEAGGKSVGVSIDLPMEEKANPFVDRDKLITFNYFFVRKVMLFKFAQGFVFLPGGFGTHDELFEALTLTQTHKISRLPIILVGKDYWSGLLDWFRKGLLEENHYINPEDLSLIDLVDSVDEVIEVLEDFYGKEVDHPLKPNF